MYLKCLELHGFKSFPNRTVLTFEKGTTVIVGPNGSGKSNLSDAMRWVLGEISSKTLRGTKMEDVIFGGTNDRRPMGFAEVSVTFDNSDKDNRINLPYEEITVTRRYFRAGDSEYMINRKPCRLRDITELFLNTGIGREGYSIVGQGRVAEIISRKSEDRRNIFEEAAGIAKYRLNKKESERKLAATEIDMNRIRDIVGVLEKRVGPLARDAEKAKKYLAVMEEKKAIDVSLWLYDTEKIMEDLKKAEDRFKLSSKQLEIVTETISDLERQLDDLEKETTRNRIRSEELVNQIQAVRDRLHALDKRNDVIGTDISNLEDRIRLANDRINEIKGQKGSLSEEREGEEKKRALLETELKNRQTEKDEALETLRKTTELLAEMDRKLEEMLTELNDVKGQAVDYRARIEILQKAESSAGSQDETMLSEIRKYKENDEKLKAEAERCDLAAAGFRTKIEETERLINELSEDVSDLESDRDEVKQKLNDAYVRQSSTLEKAKSLENLELHFQGYGATVQFIMSEYEKGTMDFGKTYFGTIYGPLSQLISMDERYHVAIETALGGNIQNIVVDDDETAKAVIRHLQKNNAGRATFLSVSTIRAQSEPDEVRQAANYTGYIDRADRVVRSDEQFREIVGWYLGRTVVFDTLEHALACSHALRSRVRIVTLDGQIINAGGAITGGSVRTSGILSRSSEIEKLKNDAKEQGKAIRKLEEELADIETDLQVKRQSLKDNEQNRDLLLTMSRTQFADLDRANANLEANRRLLEKLSSDLETLRTSREESVAERKRLQEALIEAEEKAERLNAERNAYHIKRNGVDDRKNDETEEINRLNLAIAETAKDIEAADQMIRSFDDRAESASSEIEAQNALIEGYNTRIGELKQEAEANRLDRKDVEAELSRVTGNREGVDTDLQVFEKRTGELRQKIKNKNDEKELCYRANVTDDAKRKDLLAEQERLGSRLWQEYEISYEEAVALDYPPVTKENRPELAARLTTLRGIIKSIGPVNPGAVMEYDAVKEEYETNKAQLDDLETSYKEILNVISRLETEMKRTFLEVFNKINENFGVVFRDLFGGGTAELSLSDPEDVLNTGIEIKAAPPGKIIKNMALLSGGEQTFVAIALLFSILKVNPTPFSILDEIEAALDEVNVYRLGEYIKRSFPETQFILITHRRGTMEIADRLYGVTMPDRGVSKVIPLDVNEIESKQKELFDGVL